MIKIHPISKEAKKYPPTKGTAESIAYDIYVNKDFQIAPKSVYIYDTELVVNYALADKMVNGMALHILPRSSLFLKKSCILANSVGLIDPDYNGKEDTIRMILYNTSDSLANFVKGERIGQFYFVKICNSSFVFEEYPSENKNSRGGLGSTG